MKSERVPLLELAKLLVLCYIGLGSAPIVFLCLASTKPRAKNAIHRFFFDQILAHTTISYWESEHCQSPFFGREGCQWHAIKWIRSLVPNAQSYLYYFYRLHWGLGRFWLSKRGYQLTINVAWAMQMTDMATSGIKKGTFPSIPRGHHYLLTKFRWPAL